MFKLILELKALNDVSYSDFVKKYPKIFNAFLYTHSKTLFKKHNEKNYRLLTFTKLFEIKNNKIIHDNKYYVVIISPYKDVIYELFNNFKNNNSNIMLGEGLFKINNVKKKLREKIKNFETIVLQTPVVITKQDEKIKTLTFEKNKDEYLDLLRKNMIKKYNFYYNTEIPEDFNIFNNVNVKSKGSFSTPTGYGNFYVGSELIFELGALSNIQKRIFQLSFNCGFGEKTALGFGFPELKQKYNYEDYFKNE